MQAQQCGYGNDLTESKDHASYYTYCFNTSVAMESFCLHHFSSTVISPYWCHGSPSSAGYFYTQDQSRMLVVGFYGTIW